MLLHVVNPLVLAHGFSEEVGFLHSPRRGHRALAYDFMELFRQP